MWEFQLATLSTSKISEVFAEKWKRFGTGMGGARGDGEELNRE